jgi:ferritin heavy chain
MLARLTLRPLGAPTRPPSGRPSTIPSATRAAGGGGGASGSAPNKNGGGGNAPPPQKEHAPPPAAPSRHPDSSLEYYASPSSVATPYLKDVHTAEKRHHGLARTRWTDAAAAAVNEQTGREWALSYTYEAIASAFSEGDRALPGVSAYFRKEAEGERAHARSFMRLQAKRGGSTVLPSLAAPDDFLAAPGGGPGLGPGGPAKAGDVTRAFESALALEQMNYVALEALDAVAVAEGDPQLQDFVEAMLTVSAGEVKAAADHVSQLLRVGPGLGEWLFDRELAKGADLSVFGD